jgi:outer membrane protein assembly factor BamB
MAEKGNLVIAQPTTKGYKVISEAKVLGGKCWTVPVLANGRIYIRNSKGDLLCIDVKKNNPNEKEPAEVIVSFQKNWPNWQGPKRDNKSTETNLLKQWPLDGPKRLWSAEGIGNGYSTVSIADGLLYTTGIINDEGILFAYDLQGNLKWKKSYGAEWIKDRPGTRGTPTVNDGCVYVISGTGNVSCFEAKTGEKKWAVDAFNEFKGKYPSWGIAESPLIIADAPICTPGGQMATIVALDKKTGKTVWASKSIGEKNGYCTPQLVEMGNKKIIVTMTENFIIGVDADNGNILWQYDCKNYQGKPKDVNPNTPVYQDGCLYVTTGYGKGGAKLKLSEDLTKVESQPWANLTLDCHHGGVVLVDGYIYGSNMKGDWICLDWNDGKVKYENKGVGKGSIFYADGMLYCYGENGTIALVKASPDDFNIISSFKVPKGDGPLWAHPVICDSKLYVRHGDAMMVYDIKNK